jgi:hypothetical protein
MRKLGQGNVRKPCASTRWTGWAEQPSSPKQSRPGEPAWLHPKLSSRLRGPGDFAIADGLASPVEVGRAATAVEGVGSALALQEVVEGAADQVVITEATQQVNARLAEAALNVSLFGVPISVSMSVGTVSPVLPNPSLLLVPPRVTPAPIGAPV